MSAPDKNGWPPSIRLSDFHQDEILNYMQDSDPETEHSHPGEYTRTDLCDPTQDARVKALADTGQKLCNTVGTVGASRETWDAIHAFRAALRDVEGGGG